MKIVIMFNCCCFCCLLMVATSVCVFGGGGGGGGFELGRWCDNTDGVTKWIRVSCFVRAAAY